MTKNKTIQEKMADLKALVAWFDSDDFVVEQAIEQFKKADKLATELKSDLETMKNEINVLKQRFDE